MATNPFYRFENSNWNTAFEPAFTPTVDALYDFIVDIPSGFAVGASLNFGLRLIRNIIEERNAAPYHFNFILVPSYPIPMVPVGSGTQSWQYYITDKQLISLHFGQKFVIDFTTLDGIITNTTVTPNTDVSYPYDYSLPLFPTEIAAYRALEISHANGAAFFPPEYKYDSTTGIATSSVARFQNCKFNEATGFGERYPLITAPVSPYWSLEVSAMSADERYMLLLINRIIEFGLDSTKTAAEIEVYILNLIYPDGWGVLGNFNLTGYPRVQYTFFNNDNKESLAIIGRFDAEWKWQRFFNRWTSNTIGILEVMEITSPTTQLPYPPTVGKGYSNDPENLWYDFEQICFTDACDIPVEYYPMPAKTADHLQFNVIPSMSNTTGIIESKIGLFDCQENFIQEIGKIIEFEEILCYPTQLQASIDIPSISTGEYKLGLYNQSGSALEIYATSNPIRIDNSDCFSTIIEFYGNPSSIAQGFEYYGNWRQRIRIGLNGGGAKPRITEATYRQSNGVFKRPQNKQDLTLDLHTDFFDEPTQFAMTDATRHPFLVWNDKNVFVEGDIEVATVQDFTTQSSFEDLAQMKFSVLVQGFQPKNNNCINC